MIIADLLILQQNILKYLNCNHHKLSKFIKSQKNNLFLVIIDIICPGVSYFKLHLVSYFFWNSIEIRGKLFQL